MSERSGANLGRALGEGAQEDDNFPLGSTIERRLEEFISSANSVASATDADSGAELLPNTSAEGSVTPALRPVVPVGGQEGTLAEGVGQRGAQANPVVDTVPREKPHKAPAYWGRMLLAFAAGAMSTFVVLQLAGSGKGVSPVDKSTGGNPFVTESRGEKGPFGTESTGEKEPFGMESTGEKEPFGTESKGEAAKGSSVLGSKGEAAKGSSVLGSKGEAAKGSSVLGSKGEAAPSSTTTGSPEKAAPVTPAPSQREAPKTAAVQEGSNKPQRAKATPKKETPPSKGKTSAKKPSGGIVDPFSN